MNLFWEINNFIFVIQKYYALIFLAIEFIYKHST